MFRSPHRACIADPQTQFEAGADTDADGLAASLAASRTDGDGGGKKRDGAANLGGAVIRGTLEAEDARGRPLASELTERGEALPADQNLDQRLFTIASTNRYQYTRGAALARLASTGTQSAANRASGGAFGTGTSRFEARTESVVYLEDYEDGKKGGDKGGAKGG